MQIFAHCRHLWWWHTLYCGTSTSKSKTKDGIDNLFKKHSMWGLYVKIPGIDGGAEYILCWIWWWKWWRWWWWWLLQWSRVRQGSRIWSKWVTWCATCTRRMQLWWCWTYGPRCRNSCCTKSTEWYHYACKSLNSSITQFLSSCLHPPFLCTSVYKLRKACKKSGAPEEAQPIYRNQKQEQSYHFYLKDNHNLAPPGRWACLHWPSVLSEEQAILFIRHHYRDLYYCHKNKFDVTPSACRQHSITQQHSCHQVSWWR